MYKVSIPAPPPLPIQFFGSLVMFEQVVVQFLWLKMSLGMGSMWDWPSNAEVEDGAGFGGPWNMQVFAVFNRRPLLAVRQ